MKKYLLFLLAGFLMLSCASPKGVTKADYQYSVLQMRSDTLEQLFDKRPETKEMIKEAAGYGVFSNISGYILYVGAGGGYGVVVDNSSGKETYMKMAQVGAGLGLGVKDFRVVFIFKNKSVMNDFVNKGWEFGAQADAAAKSGEKGVAVGGEVYIEKDIVIYQITEAGVALQATVGGTKYWKDDDLN